MAWLDGWDYRVEHVVESDEVPANQTDFPVYVDLSDMPAGFFTNVKSDGGDIRVTQSDGETEQAREIVTITTGSSIGEMWFKASSLSSSTDTTFYIYYGNSSASEPAADATYGSENTYDSDHSAVLHLQGSATEVLDSTSNSNDSGTTSAPGNQAAGHISNGRNFDGSTENQNWADVTDLLLGTIGTISLWAKADNYTGDSFPSFFSTRDNFGSGDDIIEHWEEGGRHNFRYGDAAASFQSSAGTAHTGVWEMFHFTWDNASGAKIFLNGAQIGSVGAMWTAASLSGTFKIAQFSNFADSNFDGMLDEFKISNIVRDNDWKTTEYNNQSDTAAFYTIGSQEEAPVSFIPQIIII